MKRQSFTTFVEAPNLDFGVLSLPPNAAQAFGNIVNLWRSLLQRRPRGSPLVTHLSFDTAAEMVEVARCAEGLGFEGALLSYPASFRPKNATEIVSFTKSVADTTDLALILFGVATWGFKSLHPSAFPPDALAEMAKLPTAASIKYEANAPGMIAGLADVMRRCGKDVLIQCPLEHYAPGLVDWYGMQFMGTSAYDSFGDRVPRWFRMLQESHWDDAMKLYWSYQAAREGRLMCRYHGVQVAGDASIAAVPGMQDCNLIGKKFIKSYPVIEHFQCIWAYFGDETCPEPCPLEIPSELLSSEWTGFIVSNTWYGNYQYVLDNLVDIMHTRFLHEESYSMGIDELTDLVEVNSTENGLVITRKNDPSNIHSMQFVDSGAFYCRVGVSLPPVLGPGGILRILATVVPY